MPKVLGVAKKIIILRLFLEKKCLSLLKRLLLCLHSYLFADYAEWRYDVNKPVKNDVWKFLYETFPKVFHVTNVGDTLCDVYFPGNFPDALKCKMRFKRFIYVHGERVSWGKVSLYSSFYLDRKKVKETKA